MNVKNRPYARLFVMVIALSLASLFTIGCESRAKFLKGSEKIVFLAPGDTVETETLGIDIDLFLDMLDAIGNDDADMEALKTKVREAFFKAVNDSEGDDDE